MKAKLVRLEETTQGALGCLIIDGAIIAMTLEPDAADPIKGLDLTAQGWWSGGADSFFGTVDSVVDMYGNTRSTWSRGAYEYAGSGPTITGITGVSISGGITLQ